MYAYKKVFIEKLKNEKLKASRSFCFSIQSYGEQTASAKNSNILWILGFKKDLFCNDTTFHVNRFYLKKISGKNYLFSSIKAENPVYNVIRISARRTETQFEKRKYFNISNFNQIWDISWEKCNSIFVRNLLLA